MRPWSRPFVGLLVAQSTSRFADAIEQVALGWTAYQLTGSATVMGLLLAWSGLPNVVLAPLAGVLADRGVKRRLVTLGFIGRATVAALLALGITGSMNVVALFALVFLASTFETLGAPAASALTTLVVDRDRLAAAAGLGASWQTAAQLAGLAAGGFLVTTLGSGAFILEAVAFAGAATAARFLITRDQPRPQEPGTSGSWVRDLREGLGYIVGDRRLRGVIALALVANFAFAPVNVLQVPFVQSVLGGGPGLLAALGVALAGGMVCGGVLVGRVARRWGTWPTVYGAFYGLGVGCAALAVAGAVANPLASGMALVSFAVLGLLLPLATAPLSGWLAAEVPLDRQGRVFSTVNALALAAVPLGAGITGVAASVVPIPGLFVVTGVLVVVATTLARRRGT